LLLIALLATAIAAQTITSTSDVIGRPRPATAEITEPPPSAAPAPTRKSATASSPPTRSNAPGFSGKLDIAKQIKIENPGYITLTCNGNSPTRGSAQIDP
jgi:hypothetical protein